MRALLGCIALVSLTACGFKGPLYLPPHPKASAPAKASAPVASKPAASAPAAAKASAAENASDPVTLDDLVE
ncbi:MULTISPECIES: LPS translocon maturation chaperone LptM [Silvimonas]|uniref:LPS translocon maturation chaperone LptM n=1 Tax=Silvimonas TaxID=300264 RepID=UPI0024B339D2|nr:MULTISPECIES: lipoprotein [Silvimonas]MDR3428037.1 lipoprotein [Silvimonas sp.]